MFYRVSVFENNDPSGSNEYEKERLTVTVKAESMEQAIEMACSELVQPSEAFAEELDVAELILESEKSLRDRICSEYLLAKNQDVSVRVFCHMVSGKRNGEENELYYEALRFFLRKIRLKNVLPRHLDLEKISGAEYERLATGLSLADGHSDYDSILEFAKEKYGKVVR